MTIADTYRAIAKGLAFSPTEYEQFRQDIGLEIGKALDNMDASLVGELMQIKAQAEADSAMTLRFDRG